jgi:hypothetical protein
VARFSWHPPRNWGTNFVARRSGLDGVVTARVRGPGVSYFGSGADDHRGEVDGRIIGAGNPDEDRVVLRPAPLVDSTGPARDKRSSFLSRVLSGRYASRRSNNGTSTPGASAVAGRFSWQPPRNSLNCDHFRGDVPRKSRQLTTVFLSLAKTSCGSQVVDQQALMQPSFQLDDLSPAPPASASPLPLWRPPPLGPRESGRASTARRIQTNGDPTAAPQT